MTGEEVFADLFVRWRFGELDLGEEAIALGSGLLEGTLVQSAAATITLRLAILCRSGDPARSEALIARARALGAFIPRELAAPDESNAPAGEPSIPGPGVETREVRAPSSRDRWPAALDGWHPAFAFAATRLPALKLTTVENGVMSVDTTGGRPEVYVFDSEGRLLTEVSTGQAPFRLDPVVCDGPLVLVDDVFGGFNVSHTLFDKLPRLQIYEEHFPGEPLTAAFFLDHPYYREALNLLGHRPFPAPGGRWTVQASRLALLSNHRRGEVMHPGFSGSDWATGFIARHFQAASPGGRRIYVSREDAAVRRLVNEAEVRADLTDRGFEIHTLGGLSFEAQRDLFHGASHIVGVHGAGLTNMVFAHPATRVLEVMPPLGGTFAYWVMAGALGQPYGVIAADDAVLPVRPGATYDPGLGERALRLPLDRLSTALDWLTGR